MSNRTKDLTNTPDSYSMDSDRKNIKYNINIKAPRLRSHSSYLIEKNSKKSLNINFEPVLEEQAEYFEEKKKKKKFKPLNEISDKKEDRLLKSKSFSNLSKYQKSKSYEKKLPKVLENLEEDEKDQKKSLRKFLTFLDHSEISSNFSILKNIDTKSFQEKNQNQILELEENFEDDKKSIDSDSRSMSSISRNSFFLKNKKLKCDEIDKINKIEDYKEIKEVIEEENFEDEENENVEVLKKTRNSLKGVFRNNMKSDLVCLDLLPNKDYKFKEPNLKVINKIEEND